jgi:plasmid stabilization system protein ParE
MSYTVRQIPNAKDDKAHIFRWLHERSPAGTAAWLDAYDSFIERLSTMRRLSAKPPRVVPVASAFDKPSSKLVAVGSIARYSTMRIK